MRYLILSDIHANLQALEAVLRDAEGCYEEICCLGDVVGYGADPNAVTEWVRTHVKSTIRGNHDKACCGIEDTEYFNPIAKAAVEYTLEKLTSDNRRYLRELDRGPFQVGHFLIVHGSVLDEDEYLIGPGDALPQFPCTPYELIFFGHTHVQGGFLLWDAKRPGEPATYRAGGSLQLTAGRRQLLNPGSVGQPRDGDWKAAYALYDSSRGVVEFRRCAYDVAAAQQRICDAGLPPQLAERLAFGR